MHGLTESRRAGRTTPLIAIAPGQLRRVLARLGSTAAAWVRNCDFRAEPGASCLLPDARGGVRAVLVGVTRADDIYALASLPRALPPGTYRIDARLGAALDVARVALGWGLGAYRFARYRKAPRAPARLAVDTADLRAVEPLLAGIWHARDLINTPTQDLGPAELAAEVMALAQAHGGEFREWVGEQLVEGNFPAIYAVGRGSHRAPRLAQMQWGEPAHPHVIVIGKGVCFDTGGLNIKSTDGMRWMKKDMGGAAHAIALAQLLIRTGVPVRLTLLVPAVENAVSADAFRPGEVIRTRAGLTVEVDNTDAEGRVILGDALAYGAEMKPDAIIDLATLTGAARVALGPDLPALYSNQDELAAALLAAGRAQQDEVWQMPLWQPYRSMLDSRIADTVNGGASRHAGAITAALYLQRFVPHFTPWIHLDLYAWNDADRPGRPHGGEAQGLRALLTMLQARYSRS